MRNLLFGVLIVVLLIAGPLGYKHWRDREYRNFRVVHEGVLYRSGQLPLPRLQQLVAQHGIRTVISLREGDKANDQQEEAWVKAKALNFVRIPPPLWYPDKDGKIPADAALAQFRKVMDDPANYPVLIHCFAGLHRTGAMCAVYRMDYNGWTNAEAISEMRLLGYSILDDHEDVLGYLTNYRPPTGGPRVLAIPVGRNLGNPHP
jgi:protein tyrosine/serine phosphatase